MKRGLVFGVILLFNSYTFAEELGVSISLKGTLTSNTRVMYDINRPSLSKEDRTVAASLGYGIDLRGTILWERFYFGISAEKVSGSTTVSQIYPMLQNLKVPMKEGFEAVMVELSGYYVVPISSETVLFYLGGGVGYCTGKRLHAVAGYYTTNVHSTSTVGIHVLTGTDFKIHSNVLLRAELKFRDPYFDATTRFDKASVVVEGKQIGLLQEERITRINLYGINYVAGLVFSI